MPPKGGIRCGEAAFIKALRAARALAKQLGTSTKMIEKNYGHDVVEDYRDELMG